MLNPKSLLHLFSVGLLLIGTQPMMAQPTTNLNNSITQVSFKPPPDEGMPDKTASAGSRGQCAQDPIQVSSTNQYSMMALVPSSNHGLTVAARPTFFIALPKTSAKQVILSIKEKGTQHHSQTPLSIKNSPGIMSLQPSVDLPPLVVGKKYQWSVVLVCGEKPGPNDPAVVSWVSRVEPSQVMPSELQKENALAQAIWYGERGLWYDTLTALVAAKRSQPESQVMSDIWTNFLASVGLWDISSEPINF